MAYFVEYALYDAVTNMLKQRGLWTPRRTETLLKPKSAQAATTYIRLSIRIFRGFLNMR